MIHRLTYSGGAQVVRTHVLHDGRPVVPASATYAVVDLRYDADDSGHTVESGSATVDSVSTTISAAAGRGTANPRQLTVTSATGIVAGRRYLLTTGGRPAVVQVVAVSGTTLLLSAPLSGYFPSSSTFVGLEIYATVSLTVCATDDYLDEPNRLAIRWTPSGYAPFLEAIHLERLAPAPLVTVDDVLRLDSSLHSYLTDDTSLTDALAQAIEDFGIEMMCAGVDDDEILAGPIGRSAIKHRCAWHVLKGSSDPSAVTRAEKYEARWAHLVAELLQGWDKAKTARLTKDATAEAPDLRSRWAGKW